MKYLREVRAALVSAVLVFCAMQFLVAVMQPYLPLILIGIVVITVGWMLFARATRL
ncbi:UNVERIFIED_ORG: fatty acid desaturase [Arthrobacter sp. UYEF1]